MSRHFLRFFVIRVGAVQVPLRSLLHSLVQFTLMHDFVDLLRYWTGASQFRMLELAVVPFHSFSYLFLSEQLDIHIFGRWWNTALVSSTPFTAFSAFRCWKVRHTPFTALSILTIIGRAPRRNKTILVSTAKTLYLVYVFLRNQSLAAYESSLGYFLHISPSLSFFLLLFYRQIKPFYF